MILEVFAIILVSNPASAFVALVISAVMLDVLAEIALVLDVILALLVAISAALVVILEVFAAINVGKVVIVEELIPPTLFTVGDPAVPLKSPVN